MLYLLPVNDTFTIFHDKESISEMYLDFIIEVESLPEGEGILKRHENGEFYYETILEPEPNPEQPTEPVQPVETIEEKLARMEKQLEAQQQQSLMIVDINLTLYEEVLTLREEIASLKGTGNV